MDILFFQLKFFESKIAQGKGGKGRRPRTKRQAESNNSTEPEILPRMSSARYTPVYADCVCEINKAGEKSKGSCLPSHKGTIGKDFVYPRNKYRKSICLCDYDANYKSAWPCFPCK